MTISIQERKIEKGEKEKKEDRKLIRILKGKRKKTDSRADHRRNVEGEEKIANHGLNLLGTVLELEISKIKGGREEEWRRVGGAVEWVTRR